MKIEWADVEVNGKNIKARITKKENGDQVQIKKIYDMWNTLNKAIKAISTRGINLPEAISEIKNIRPLSSTLEVRTIFGLYIFCRKFLWLDLKGGFLNKK